MTRAHNKIMWALATDIVCRVGTTQQSLPPLVWMRGSSPLLDVYLKKCGKEYGSSGKIRVRFSYAASPSAPLEELVVVEPVHSNKYKWRFALPELDFTTYSTATGRAEPWVYAISFDYNDAWEHDGTMLIPVGEWHKICAGFGQMVVLPTTFFLSDSDVEDPMGGC